MDASTYYLGKPVVLTLPYMENVFMTNPRVSPSLSCTSLIRIKLLELLADLSDWLCLKKQSLRFCEFPSDTSVLAHSVCQFVHDVTENHRIYILAKHVEEEPVTHFGISYNCPDIVRTNKSKTHPKEINPHPGTHDDDDPVQDTTEGKYPQNEEPEPEEDVYLLVDDIQRKDAHGIVTLHLAGDTVLVESAFCHSGKDVDHWIHTVFLVALHKFEDIYAKHKEFSVEETVHQEHLTCIKKYLNHQHYFLQGFSASANNMWSTL